MNWQQQDNEQRQRWEEMLRKMEGEVEQGRMIRKNALQQIIELKQVTEDEHKRYDFRSTRTKRI